MGSLSSMEVVGARQTLPMCSLHRTGDIRQHLGEKDSYNTHTMWWVESLQSRAGQGSGTRGQGQQKGWLHLRLFPGRPGMLAKLWNSLGPQRWPFLDMLLVGDWQQDRLPLSEGLERMRLDHVTQFSLGKGFPETGMGQGCKSLQVACC